MSPKGRSAKSVLITGCDSGVALEVVKALAQEAEGQSNVAVILAAAKNPNNSELHNIAKTFSKVKTIQLDLEDQKNFGNFATEVQKRLNDAGVQHLSALINSAALHFNTTLSNVDAGHMIKAFSVNAVSPLMLIKALSKQLQGGAQPAGSGAVAGGSDATLFSSSKASQAGMVEMQGPSDALHATAFGGAPVSSPRGGVGLLHSQLMAGAECGQGTNLDASQGTLASRFGVGGPNSGAILVGDVGSAFSGNGGGLVVNLTTGLSSTGANDSGRFYAYRASKSALNMIIKNVASDLASSGILAFSLNIDNAAMDSQGAGAGSQGNNGNSTQGYNAQGVAQAINNLVSRGNFALSGSLINVEGTPLLF